MFAPTEKTTNGNTGEPGIPLARRKCFKGRRGREGSPSPSRSRGSKRNGKKNNFKSPQEGENLEERVEKGEGRAFLRREGFTPPPPKRKKKDHDLLLKRKKKEK